MGYLHSWIWGASATPWRPSVSYEANVICQFTGLFRAVHALSRRTGSVASRAALSDELLSDDFGGRSIGGLSVSLVAPQVFNSYAEWKIGLVGGFVLAATVAFVLAGSTGSAFPAGAARDACDRVCEAHCGPAAF